MMTLAQILASHWRSFLAISDASFAAFAFAIILLLPGPRILVRSAIDIGSYFLRGEASPIYSPDALAKRTLNVYVPLTLSRTSREGTPTKIISALQSSIIEATQLSIVITTTVDAGDEDAARRFHEHVANLILSGEKSRVDVLRDAAAARATATNLGNYEKQLSTEREQIDRINKRIEEIENSRRDQKAELASMLPPQQSTSQADEQASLQARIRQLQDQLAKDFSRPAPTAAPIAARTRRPSAHSDL
jgi:hypothetical protein